MACLFPLFFNREAKPRQFIHSILMDRTEPFGLSNPSGGRHSEYSTFKNRRCTKVHYGNAGKEN